MRRFAGPLDLADKVGEISGISNGDFTHLKFS
jgi:hypothetical protein